MMREYPRLNDDRVDTPQAFFPEMVIKLVRTADLMPRIDRLQGVLDLGVKVNARMVIESTSDSVVGVSDAIGEDARPRQQQKAWRIDAPTRDNISACASHLLLAVKSMDFSSDDPPIRVRHESCYSYGWHQGRVRRYQKPRQDLLLYTEKPQCLC